MGLHEKSHLKYLVVSLRPSSTGVFWPTDCLITQLPSAMRGMILKTPFLSFWVSSSPLLLSRNLHGREAFSQPHIPLSLLTGS